MNRKNRNGKEENLPAWEVRPWEGFELKSLLKMLDWEVGCIHLAECENIWNLTTHFIWEESNEHAKESSLQFARFWSVSLTEPFKMILFWNMMVFDKWQRANGWSSSLYGVTFRVCLLVCLVSHFRGCWLPVYSVVAMTCVQRNVIGQLRKLFVFTDKPKKKHAH